MATGRHDEEWLDRLLRESPAHVPDNGFTARVMAGLPPARRPWYASREFVLLVATVLSCAAGLALPGVADYLAGSLTDVLTLKSLALDKLAVLVPIALLYWGGIAAAAAER